MRIFLLQSLMINVILPHEGRDHVCPSQGPIVSLLLERMNELPSQHKDFQNPPPTPHFCSWVPAPLCLQNYLLCLSTTSSSSVGIKWSTLASLPVLVICCHTTNLSPNLGTLNNTHIATQSFWESRMQEQLSSRALALRAIKSSAGTLSPEGLAGCSICF